MIIACDVGLKRIGLAGLIGQIVLPLAPIIRKNRNQAALELSRFLEHKGAERLVVGLPELSSTQDGEMHQRIKHFIGLLSFGGEIIYINEDYSSVLAFENLFHMGKKSRQQACKNGKLDSLAACEILQRYITQHTPIKDTNNI
ncbi:Holliday junction DNA helicase RuvA [Helicobacter sp. 12S02634-8]|uniref:Holliday junction resolvase RuvX n=1 Tax=Helicobacter sp. 12S02634-8 TaxID=1476199 RepID=UPI000BA7C246|nr:Holliday junction resolvase RuvX [Helicobacter sp. 12S02634-8]PAF47830.1 Holliday junction DNA helicase RuvA [Helicobacter sp. 12S02634-8]